jgi:hypothetical protein
MATKKRLESVLFLSLLAMLPFWYSGCQIGPSLTEVVVSTPGDYPENKVLYLGPKDCSAGSSDAMRPLRHLYELDVNDPNNKYYVNHGDPIAVVLNGVRLPQNERGSSKGRDIAVVLDMITFGKQKLDPLVVFYQRNVYPEQMLNFQNLVVYCDPSWDSSIPPYFRVRMIDVKAEKNRNTRSLLKKCENLGKNLSGLIPHPALPVVSIAIEAANAVLSNHKNKMILDFQVQFFSVGQMQSAGDALLGGLRKGQWLVVGRPKSQNSSFWNKQIYLDRRTDRLREKISLKGKSDFTNLRVPYVSTIIFSSDVQVPSLVMDRSHALLKLLSTSAIKTDPDSLDAVAEQLDSAIKTYTALRRLSKYRSMADVKRVYELLSEYKTDKRAADGTSKLKEHEIRELLRAMQDVTDIDFSSAQHFIDWWGKTGEKGQLTQDTRKRYGVKWEPRSEEKNSQL